MAMKKLKLHIAIKLHWKVEELSILVSNIFL